MRKFILNKVVRTGLIARMEADKTEVERRVLTGTPAVKAVLHKIIEEAQEATERGRFVPAIFVETVNVQDDDPMAAYYGSDPERFPEVRE